MSFTYKQTEPALWTVGEYDPSGKWYPISDHGSSEEARREVAKLNGGGCDCDELTGRVEYLERRVKELAEIVREYVPV